MKQEFSIKGMSCNHCVSKVEEAVRLLEGVKRVKINLKKENGVVKFDETKIQPEKISLTINELGYNAEVL